MQQFSSSTVPNEHILDGLSPEPPSIVGDPVNGLLLAWTDATASGQIFLATDEDVPPFDASIVNPDWLSFSTPALVYVSEWDTIFLAWTTPDGAVNLGSSALDWKNELQVAPPGSALAGPAMTFGNNLLFLAWQSQSPGEREQLSFASLDATMTIQTAYTTDQILLFSRPSLTWHQGTLYLLSGGDLDTNYSQMNIAISTNNGNDFDQLSDIQATSCFGPPSLVIVNDVYYLAWAESNAPYYLCFAATQSLSSFQVTRYAATCHNGGPSIAGSSAGLVVGWSYGASPDHPDAHHITFGTPPLVSAREKSRTQTSMTITGRITAQQNHAIAGATLLALDSSDPVNQFMAVSNAQGRYELLLPSGTYDIIVDAAPFVTHITAGIVVQHSLMMDHVLEQASRRPNEHIFGTLRKRDGSPVSGWEISTRWVNAPEKPSDASTTTDADGAFTLVVEEVAYLLLDCSNPEQSVTISVPLPKPETAVEIELLVDDPPLAGLARSQKMLYDTLERLRMTVPSETNRLFQVCRSYQGTGQWGRKLQGGLLPPDGGNMRTNSTPAAASIWVETIHSLLFDYCIYVDTSVLTKPGAPLGQYTFTDETNDSYTLSARLPLLHRVGYNSDKPTITQVDLEIASFSSQYWISAPLCPKPTEENDS